MDLAGLGKGPVVGFCEHSDELLGSIKKAGFFDKLGDNQLFK
jgi:hypothetical protein